MEDLESNRRKPSPNIPGGAGYKFGLEQDWVTICLGFWASCPNNKIPLLYSWATRILVYYPYLRLHVDNEESDRWNSSPNVPGGAGYKFGLELHIGQQFATASELHAQMIIFHCSSVGLPVSLLSLVKIACGQWRVRQMKFVPTCSRRSWIQIWTRTAHWATICTSFWASCPNNKIPSLSRCYG